MTATELPPALRPWSASLAFLSVEAALHIGPLVRRLDALVRRHDATNAPRGEPDGYGGLTNRGHPERLLLSEWLLAEELPLEFIRRAAQPRAAAHRADLPRARSRTPPWRCSATAGPDQLGAARLVQLAALIVLHRRAHARGTELRLGALRRARRPLAQRRAARAVRGLARGGRAGHAGPGGARPPRRDPADELWVLAGDTLAQAAHDRPLLLHTTESACDEHGVTAVDVRFEGRTTRCRSRPGRCPCRRCAAQLLRRRATSGTGTSAAALSCPSFHGADRRLLLRGDRPDTLRRHDDPDATRAAAPRARARTASAARSSPPPRSAGSGCSALTLHGDVLRCEVVGKSLPSVDRLEIALDHVELQPGDLDLTTLPPVYYDRESVLFEGARRVVVLQARRGAVPRRTDRRRRADPPHRPAAARHVRPRAALQLRRRRAHRRRPLRPRAAAGDRGPGADRLDRGRRSGRSTGAACTGARSRSTRATPCSASWPSCARRTRRW